MKGSLRKRRELDDTEQETERDSGLLPGLRGQRAHGPLGQYRRVAGIR